MECQAVCVLCFRNLATSCYFSRRNSRNYALKGSGKKIFLRDGDRAGQSLILRDVVFEMHAIVHRATPAVGRHSWLAVCSRQSVGRELVVVMLMRSGTGPSEPCEIANFDPIHARVTTPVFPISISADLSRSTARYAIGVSLFLPPFFFSFFSPSCAASAVGDDGETSVSLLETMTRACAREQESPGRASYLHSATALSVFPLAIATLPRASPRFVSGELHHVDLTQRRIFQRFEHRDGSRGLRQYVLFLTFPTLLHATVIFVKEKDVSIRAIFFSLRPVALYLINYYISQVAPRSKFRLL